MPIVDQMSNGETPTHARLGISVSDVANPTGAAVAEGAQVQQVTAGSTAADAGLAKGDVITKVDDHLITGADSLVATIRSYRPGDKVTVTYQRGGDTKTAQLQLDSDAAHVQLDPPGPAPTPGATRAAPGDRGRLVVRRYRRGKAPVAQGVPEVQPGPGPRLPNGPSPVGWSGPLQRVASRPYRARASDPRGRPASVTGGLPALRRFWNSPSRATGPKPSRSLTATMWRVDLGVVRRQLGAVRALALEQPQVGDLDREARAGGRGRRDAPACPTGRPCRARARWSRCRCRRRRRRPRRAPRCCTSCAPAGASSASPSRTHGGGRRVSGSQLQLAGRRLGHQRRGRAAAQPSSRSSGTGPTHERSVYAAWCGAASAASSSSSAVVDRQRERPASRRRARARSRARRANSGAGLAGAVGAGGVRPQRPRRPAGSGPRARGLVLEVGQHRASRARAAGAPGRRARRPSARRRGCRAAASRAGRPPRPGRRRARRSAPVQRRVPGVLQRRPAPPRASTASATSGPTARSAAR